MGFNTERKFCPGGVIVVVHGLVCSTRQGSLGVLLVARCLVWGYSVPVSLDMHNTHL